MLVHKELQAAVAEVAAEEQELAQENLIQAKEPFHIQAAQAAQVE